MTAELALDPDRFAAVVLGLIVALFVLCMVCSIVARLRPEPKAATRTRPTSSNRKAGRGSL